MPKSYDFINKLKSEIADLKADIDSLIKYEKELHESRSHTNFVYLENLVVLKDEIMGLDGILGILNNFENTEINIESNISEIVMNQISAFIKARGYPGAIEDMIKRKIDNIHI